MIDKLRSCPIANRKFALYYKANEWQLGIPLKEFLSHKFVRYQQQIFIDFIATQNIGILISPKGFIIYVLDPSRLDENDIKASDWLFLESNHETGWYVIASIDVKPLPTDKLDALLANVRSEAIIYTMNYLNNNKNFLV